MDARTGLPVVGMVGAGPVARMTHQAAVSLGQRLRVLAGPADDLDGLAGADVVVGDCRSATDLRAFAAGCDVLTSTGDEVPADLLEALAAEGVAVQPGAAALRPARDPLLLQRCLADARIPARANPAAARTLVAVVARSPYGQGAVWQVAQVTRDGGEEVAAPAPGLPVHRAEQAQQLALRVASVLDATGVLAVEFAEAATGEPLVAGVALGPDRAALWTVDGSRTSQFEQHLRAVLDYPFGVTAPTAPVAVTVVLRGGSGGVVPASLDERVHHCLARWPDVKLHLYGTAVRPGSEFGHVTALGADPDDVRQRARAAAHYLIDGGRL